MSRDTYCNSTWLHTCVRSLTLMCAACLTGCAYLTDHIGETCKTHAYIRQGLSDYISKRYHSDAPVRLGIIPFTVPENLATVTNARPGLDATLAWRLHGAFLDYQELPIVEILTRQDWPGKKDEFFTGNFGALRMARDAGYDLVMVGYVEPLREVTSLTAYGKILDTESGVTVWYGRSEVYTRRKKIRDAESFLGLRDERQDYIYSAALTDELARCLVKNALKEEPK
jgi:hypothetical protein